MNTIKCPLEAMLNEEINLGIIFDTCSIKEQVSHAVYCVLKYVIKNKEKDSTKHILNIIKANLGEIRYNIIKEQYIDSLENNEMNRYLLITKEHDIIDIIDSFNIIFSLMPALERATLL